jgi:hypothetical protein
MKVLIHFSGFLVNFDISPVLRSTCFKIDSLQQPSPDTTDGSVGICIPHCSYSRAINNSAAVAALKRAIFGQHE